MNIIGKRFGRLVVTEEYKKENKRVFCKCKCDCGKEKDIYKYSLINGVTKSCGCLNKEMASAKLIKINKENTIDLTNKRFGKLTVIKRIENTECNHVQWLCKCDCGNFKKATTQGLTKGYTTHCGCVNNHCGHGSHNMANTRIYEIWEAMKSRCLNPNNPIYYRYGGRGITVCKEWLDFETFYNDMVETYKNNLTLDRIDNDKGYYKENCRWVTHKQQMNNTSRCRYFDYKGEKLTMTQLLEKYNPLKLAQNTFLYRVEKIGMSIDEALNTPRMTKNRK